MAFSLHLCLPFAHKSTASEEKVRVTEGKLTKAKWISIMLKIKLMVQCLVITRKLWQNYEKIISQLLEEISQLGQKGQKMTTIYWIMAGEITQKSLWFFLPGSPKHFIFLASFEILMILPSECAKRWRNFQPWTT